MTNDNLGYGQGPASLGSPGSGAIISFPYEMYQSPQLDLTQINLGIELVPAKPGYIATRQGSLWVIELVQGVQTVPLQVQAGSNAAHTNFFASSPVPSNVDVNGAVPPCFATSPVVTSAANTVQQFPNTPIIMDVTVGAQGTGGFALKGRLCSIVFWAPVQQ